MAIKKPKIYVDKSTKYKVVYVGQKVTLWLRNIYNIDEFDFVLDGIPSVKISDYEYEITPTEKGFFNLKLIVSNRLKSKQVESSSFLLIVM